MKIQSVQRQRDKTESTLKGIVNENENQNKNVVKSLKTLKRKWQA